MTAELGVTVKKSERFVRRLFQAAVEIIKVAEGLLCRFPRLRQFPQASPSAAFFLFCFFFLSLLPTGMSRPGTHPRIGELEDRFELLVDLLRQLKWVFRI